MAALQGQLSLALRKPHPLGALTPLKPQLLSGQAIRSYKSGIDWSKNTDDEFYHRQLLENPEFFKAFPHLAHLRP